jgi:dienelactone hydrolase
MKLLFTVLFLCFISLTAYRCQPSGNPRTPDADDTTVVVRTIKCQLDTEQSYCIALPNGFDPDRHYPVIFVFDPHGDGHLAVHTFGAGASEFGYIVAGSNDIRNGYEKTEYALQALTGDVTNRYPVDRERMYAAGFSGGARVAQEFSRRNRDIKAIACIGAGYSGEQAGIWQNEVSVLFIAGNEDFNYHEIRNSYRIMASEGIHCFVLEYSGKHAWPGPEIIHDAMLWFEFDDYRRNPDHEQKQIVREYLAEIRRKGAQQEEQNEIFAAAFTYAKGLSFMSGIANTGFLKRKLAGLQKTEAFMHSEKQANDALEMEIRLQQGYMLALRERDTLWWRNEIRGLDEKISRGDNGTMQPVYNRLRSYISIAAYSYCNSSLTQNDLLNAEKFISIYRVVDPGNPDVYYFHALFLAKTRQNRAAAESFGKAVSMGFTDLKKARRELPEEVISGGLKP